MSPPSLQNNNQHSTGSTQPDFIYRHDLNDRDPATREAPTRQEPPWRSYDQFFGHDEAFGRWVSQYQLYLVDVGHHPIIYPSYRLLRTTSLDGFPKADLEALQANGQAIVTLPLGTARPKILHTLRNALLLSLWGLGPTCHGYLELPDGSFALVMDESVDAISLRSQNSALAYPEELQERINPRTFADLQAIEDFFTRFWVSVDGEHEDYLLLPDGRLQVTRADALSFLRHDITASLILPGFLNHVLSLQLPHIKAPSEPPAKVGGLVRRNGHGLLGAHPISPARIPELTKLPVNHALTSSARTIKSALPPAPMAPKHVPLKRWAYSARPLPTKQSFAPRAPGKTAMAWRSHPRGI